MTNIALNEALRVVIWRTKDLDLLRDQLFRLKTIEPGSMYYRVVEESQLREEWRVCRQTEIRELSHQISHEEAEYSPHSSVKMMCSRLMKLHMSYERPTDTREHLLSITHASDMSKAVSDKMRQIETLLASGKRQIGALLGLCFEYSEEVYAAEIRRLGEIAEKKRAPSSNKENASVRSSANGLDKTAVGQYERQFKSRLTEEFKAKQVMQAAEALRRRSAAKAIQKEWRRYAHKKRNDAVKQVAIGVVSYQTRKRAWRQRTFSCRKCYLWERLRHWYPLLVAKFRTRRWKPYKDLAYYLGELSECVTIQRFARGYIARKQFPFARAFASLRSERSVHAFLAVKRTTWKVAWETDLELLTHFGNLEKEKTIYETYAREQKAHFESDWRSYDQKLRTVIAKGLETSRDWMEVDGWWMNMKLGLRQLEPPLNIVYERNKAGIRKKAEDALRTTLAAVESANEQLMEGARMRMQKLKQALRVSRTEAICVGRI